MNHIFRGIFAAAALLSASTSAQAVVVNGLVEGFSEGYTRQFDITVDIEGGVHNGIAGGTLFADITGSVLNVGFVSLLTINDNTYGANKASDWGSIDHFLLGGGDGLEGSDKWELKLANPGSTSNDIEIKLDYIKSAKTDPVDFDAVVERFKVDGSDVSPTGVLAFESSLSYNFDDLGLTQFFDDDKGNPIASPGPAPAPAPGDPTGPVVYDFASPAADWVPEIMYEWSIDTDALGGSIDAEMLLAAILTQPTGCDKCANVFHMSPNKLGGHKVFITGGTEVSVVPLPAALPLFGSSLGLLAFLSRRRKKS